jgi:hypothetical protein
MADQSESEKHPALPATYSVAKAALAECVLIDECKDWADKAQALAVYARQAKDKTLERDAKRIRARAVRRCGQLIQATAAKAGPSAKGKRKNSRGAHTISRRRAAQDAGLSKQQQDQAVNVARIPEDQFEEQVESDDPPAVPTLAKQGVQPRQSAKGRKTEDQPASALATQPQQEPPTSAAEPTVKSDPESEATTTPDRTSASAAPHAEAPERERPDPWMRRSASAGTEYATGDLITSSSAGSAAVIEGSISAAGSDLATILGALVTHMNERGLSEKDLPQLVAAKPLFDDFDLRELATRLNDLADCWKGLEQRVTKASKKMAAGNADLSDMPLFSNREERDVLETFDHPRDIT